MQLLAGMPAINVELWATLSRAAGGQPPARLPACHATHATPPPPPRCEQSALFGASTACSEAQSLARCDCREEGAVAPGLGLRHISAERAAARHKPGHAASRVGAAADQPQQLVLAGGGRDAARAGPCPSALAPTLKLHGGHSTAYPPPATLPAQAERCADVLGCRVLLPCRPSWQC